MRGEEPLAQLGVVGHFEGPLPVKAHGALGEESLDPDGAVDRESPLQAFSTGGAACQGGAHGHVVIVCSAASADPQLLLATEQLLNG